MSLTKKIFAINLSDNGSEFYNFYLIEENQHDEEIGKVFFTRPYQSSDKADCERNHELVRYCIPKYKNFDHLTQEKIDEMFSNINSYIRKSKNDKTPYELVKEKYGVEFLNAINIKEINKKEVKLLPII